MWIRTIIPTRRLANEINMYTGGIGSSIGIYPNVKKQGEIGLYYEVRTKSARIETAGCNALD